jgi:hypothetical protein
VSGDGELGHPRIVLSDLSFLSCLRRTCPESTANVANHGPDGYTQRYFL